MDDERLAELFAEGTAPERDAAFAARVAAEIGRARLRTRFLILALQGAVALTVGSALFVAARAAEPAVTLIAASSPHVMGVPAPAVLGVLLIGLTVGGRRFLPGRMGAIRR